MNGRIAVGYLLCRIPDTIEDAGHIPAEAKADLLHLYNQTFEPESSTTPNEFRDDAMKWALDENPEWDVIEQTPRVFNAFTEFTPSVRDAMLSPIRELIGGMEQYAERMDGGLRIRSRRELDDYCYYVAGTVGHLITNLVALQADDDDVAYLRERAESFGLLLQLVNITKDVHGDYHKENVVYLPRDWLDEAGVPQDDILDPIHRDGARTVARRVINHARAFLDPAQEYLSRLEKIPQSEMAAWALPYILSVATLRELDDNINRIFTKDAVKVTREEVFALIDAFANGDPDLAEIRSEVSQRPYIH